MPRLTRRQFLQIGGAGLAAGAVPQGAARAMELDAGGRSFNYARVAAERKKTAFTVSPFARTPQQVFLENDKVVSSGGFLDHPATRGRCYPADLVAHMTATDPDRLLVPLKREGKRGEGKWKKITWQQATDEIAKALRAATAKSAAGVWLLRGEDSGDGVWKRFMHTLGSPSTLQLCTAGCKTAGQTLTWGEDSEVPDFSHARYILNFGSNLFETFPAHAAAVAEARADHRAKLVSFDPRMSMTAGKSDEWVPLLPGTDGLVALAMANVIMREGLADTAFINAWTNVKADALAKHLAQFSPEMAAQESGVPAETIRRIAIEFASEKPATVFSHRGAVSHVNGTDTERAVMLLAVVTGNVEVKGGYCLPRRIQWEDVKPVPPAPARTAETRPALFPQAARSGRAKVGVLFAYDTNPAHDAVAAAYWAETLKDEKAVPFFVAVGTHMSETAQLADIVLPEACYLERHEPVSCASLYPWLAVRTPVSPLPGEVKELKVMLRDIVHALDKEGNRGLKKYWDFENPEDWLAKCMDSIPKLKADGGLDTVRDNGIWPNYGSLDVKTGKVLNDGKPLRADYGKHKKGGFRTASKKIELASESLKKRGFDPLPGWRKPANLAGADGKTKLAFITFRTAYHAGAATENNKYLMEKDHHNHCQINKKTATALGIKDGDLIRLTSPVGYLVTRARATQSVHPQVVAMAGGYGHKALGRVARAQSRQQPEWFAEGEDPDVRFNLWWEDRGVNPYDIMPLFADAVSGTAATACVVGVEKAKDGDSYGDVKVDAAAHEAFFKKAAEVRS